MVKLENLILCPVSQKYVTVAQFVGFGWLVGWFGVKRSFETVFQSISGRLPKRGRKRREKIVCGR